jgi:hypothetical protein
MAWQHFDIILQTIAVGRHKHQTSRLKGNQGVEAFGTGRLHNMPGNVGRKRTWVRKQLASFLGL